MQQPFTIEHGGLVLAFGFHGGGRLRLLTVAPQGVEPVLPVTDLPMTACLDVALHCTGENRDDHHGIKFTGSMPGMRLDLRETRSSDVPDGRCVEFEHVDPVRSLIVTSVYRFYEGVPAFRRSVSVRNEGKDPVGIEYLSSGLMHSFGRFGKAPADRKLRVHVPRNTWLAEGQWKVQRIADAGYSTYGMGAVAATSTGNWSTATHLPMGMLENTDAGLTWFWQIDHNGSWHWEIGSLNGDLYLYAGGPDEEHHHAWKLLAPGETYESVPVGMGCVKGGFDEAVAALTRYRRAACLRPHPDNRHCPVIFNDYMNCLWADPTTAREKPMIDAAAAAGCEYYVIDAGWYNEQGEPWWSTIGLWEPSQTRFAPDGLEGLIAYIRSKGMVPGLWLEIEAAGVNSPLKDKPDAWFFMRHGKRVVDHGRFQLDFRNPDVRTYANGVVDRLRRAYGIGYIKMDYNMTFQAGTERETESAGQGLLGHNRAYLAWLDSLLARYPDLVIENCSSGGLRMDYGMLSHHQLQSSSDQSDAVKYPGILVGALAGVLPEQLAVWSYPKADGDAREAAFNMINAMLCRIHQSGALASLGVDSFAQVREGIRIYRDVIRPHVPAAVPFFPLGLPDFTDPLTPVAVGLRAPAASFLAVWRLDGGAEISVPNTGGNDWELLYPTTLGIRSSCLQSRVTVEFPAPRMAAVLRAVP